MPNSLRRNRRAYITERCEEMVPNVVTCDLCGATAVVMAWTPIFGDILDVTTDRDGQGSREISCKIDCPNCGSRTQVLRVKSAPEPEEQ